METQSNCKRTVVARLSPYFIIIKKKNTDLSRNRTWHKLVLVTEKPHSLSDASPSCEDSGFSEASSDHSIRPIQETDLKYRDNYELNRNSNFCENVNKMSWNTEMKYEKLIFGDACYSLDNSPVPLSSYKRIRSKLDELTRLNFVG